MKEEKKPIKKWMYWFTLGLSLLVVYKVLNDIGSIFNIFGEFLSVIAPFMIGAFIAYLLYLPCRKIEKALENSESNKRRKKRKKEKNIRGKAVLLTYTIIILIIIVLINFILPVVVESVTDLINNVPAYIESTIENYNNLPEDSMLKSEYTSELIKNVQEIDLKQYVQLDVIVKYAGSAVSAVTSIFDVFVALIVSIYILLERRNIIHFLKKLTNRMFANKTSYMIRKYFNETNEIFSKFIGAQFLDAMIMGVLVSIAMSIIGVKYAILLGFLIGLFNMIPYVGAIIAVGLSVIITLITGGIAQTLIMFVVVIIIQQIDANVINPKIIGQSLKISPLIVIMGVTIGGAYFGLIGMFLGVPVAAVIKLILNDYMTINKENDEIINQ